MQPNALQIAHQHLLTANVRATVHLEPNDSPFAGEPSFTWIHLTKPNGETISLADCTCNLTVYNTRNQPIAQPPLAESEVEGHERPITTNLTFPSSGLYQLVLTGHPKREGEFEPFKLTVSVTVRS